jgi:chromosomal replication initiation ATPase DnaA
LGGWEAVKERRGSERTLLMCDERILGETDFVEAILAQAEEQYTRQHALQQKGIGIETVVARVAELCGMDPEEVVAPGRQQRKADARALLCYWAVRDLGLPLTALARRLGLSRSGISYAVQRGAALVRERQYVLVK